MALPLMANHVPVNICHIECYLDFGNPFHPLKESFTFKKTYFIPLLLDHLSIRSPNLIPSLLLAHWEKKEEKRKLKMMTKKRWQKNRKEKFKMKNKIWRKMRRKSGENMKKRTKIKNKNQKQKSKTKIKNKNQTGNRS